MVSRCIVNRADGRACTAQGAVFDPLLGGLVCYAHAPAAVMLRHALRRAIGRPETYLAAALAELTDEWLAAELGCPEERVWRLRMCGYPRADRWAQDVASMATVLNADAARLDALLRRLAPGRLPLA